MLDAQTTAIIHKHIARTNRSLLEYIVESYPWLRDGEEKAWSAIQQMLDRERKSAVALGRFLVKNHVGPPYLGAYPLHFTTMNYIALDRVFPLLIAHQRVEIEELERDIAAIQNSEAKALLEAMLRTKRENLETMQRILKEITEPESAAPEAAPAAEASAES